MRESVFKILCVCVCEREREREVYGVYLLVSVGVVPGGEKCDQIVTHVPRRRRERARRRRRRGEHRRGSRPEEDLDLAQSVVGEGRRRKILGGWKIEVEWPSGKKSTTKRREEQSRGEGERRWR